jgi:hypothetical protein
MADQNITYEALAPQLKTGDIVIMRGNSRFQQVLEVLTESPYVHSAMVVLSKDIGMKDNAAPILLWESTPYAITEDQKIHKPKTGPTLTDLKTRLNDELAGDHFDAFVFRLLNRPLGQQQFDGLKTAIRIRYPDQFPSDFWFFVKGILGRLFNREVQPSTFFCSELVAYSYQQMGILGKQHPPDYYEPKDFSAKGHLSLLQGLTLGEELNLELRIS